MFSPYYINRISELRSLGDGWDYENGKTPSRYALDVTEELLKKIDPDYRFDITPCNSGNICLEIDLCLRVPIRHSITCTISNDRSLKILMWGIPQELLEEGKSLYTLPDELSECSEFINKCLHAFGV